MKRANLTRPIIFACLLMLLLSSFLAMSNQQVFSKSAPTKRLTSTLSGASEVELSSVNVVTHKITVCELEKLKRMVGVSEPYQDYSLIIDGHGTGLRPPTREEWAKIAEEAQIVEQVLWNNQETSVPSKVDHTDSPWFPPIGDQDGESSCVAWAVGYYMKTFQEAKEHGWNLSNANWEGEYGQPTPAYQDRIFSPDFIYHQLNGGSNSYTYYHDAMNLVCSIGACYWKEMPYDPHDSTSWPSESAWREASLYRGNSTGFEYMWLDTSIANLKNWIASDHLAVINIDAWGYSSLTGDDVWTLDNYGGGGGHANTIVGYDDDFEYTEEGETRHGVFKLANSMGVGGWENIPDGCCWISYEAIKQREGHCMLYRDRIGYDPKLVASFKIDHSKRGECDITIGIGNKSAPIQTKRFDDWYQDGGNQPFCSNNIVFDITEFKDAVPTVNNQSFFIKVYDGGSSTTGTITSFSIEYYHNYSSPVPYANATSDDPPVNTINNNYVFADATLVLPEREQFNFDFGTEGSPVETGYVQVTPTTLYSLSVGYGWASASDLWSRDRLLPDDARRDFVFSSLNKTFKVHLPNGDYLIMVIMGDQSYIHDNIFIYAEDVLEATVSTEAGEFVQKVFEVSIADDALDLMFHDDGGSDSNWVINAVLIKPYSENKFDFGTEASPVESGHTQVLTSTSYSGSTGYGWADTVDLYARDRGAPDNLRRDFVFSSSNRTFNIDLPNGKYMVIILIGDNSFRHDSIDIYCEGTLVVNDLTVEKGYFAEVAFLAEVSDGQLEIMFCNDGGTDPNWVVNSIHVKTTFDLRLELDFGTASSPVKNGCVRVTPTTAYSPSASYGWSDVTNLCARDRGAPDGLKRDFVFSSVDHTFNVDLPNGQYQVTLVIGDQNYMHDNIDVYAEDDLVVEDLTAPAGMFIEVSFTVTVNDGQLNVTFHDHGGSDINWVINSLVIAWND